MAKKFNRQAAIAAGYSEEEINNFLKSPEAKKVESDSMSGTEKVGKFLLSLIEPTTGYLGKLARMEAGPLPAIAKGLQQTEGQPGMARLTALPGVLGQIAKEEIKPAANVTSFLVPGAKLPGFGAGVLPGVLSGALFGASQEDASLTSILGSGATGGLAGGFLNKILPPSITGALPEGELGKGNFLQRAGQGLRESAVPPEVTASPTMASRTAKLMAFERANKLTGSAASRKVTMNNLFRQTEKRVQETVTDKTINLTKTDIRKAIIEQVSDSSLVDLKKGEYKRELSSVMRKILKVYEGTEKSLLKSRRSIDVGKGFRKVADPKGAAILPKEAVRMETYKALSSLLGKKVPGLKPLMEKERNLFELAPGYKAAAERFDVVPFVGARLRPNAMQAAKDALGRGAEDLGTGVAKLGQVATPLKPLVVPSVIQRINSGQDQGTAIKEWGEESLKNIETLNQEYIKAADAPSAGGLNEETMRKIMISDLISTGGKNIPELKTISEMGMGSADQKKKEVLKGNAERIISELERLYYEDQELASGRLGGVVSRGKAMIGVKPKLNTYLRARNGSRAIIARAFGEVGNLSGPEQENAVALLPTEFSTPEEASMGFQSMRTLLGIPPGQH